MTHILIPIKDLSRAKGRLSDILSPKDRKDLVIAMLTDILTTVMSNDLGQVWIISSDDRVDDLAQRFGLKIIHETQVIGYNQAVKLGLEAVPADQNIVILPGDVPLVTGQEIKRLISPVGVNTGKIRLAPDRYQQGTNGLFLARRNLITPDFGHESFQKYQNTARDLDLSLQIITAPGLARDIDLPADLINLAKSISHGETYNFLCSIGFIKLG